MIEPTLELLNFPKGNRYRNEIIRYTIARTVVGARIRRLLSFQAIASDPTEPPTLGVPT
jgi:hypothetical protein